MPGLKSNNVRVLFPTCTLKRTHRQIVFTKDIDKVLSEW